MGAETDWVPFKAVGTAILKSGIAGFKIWVAYPEMY
jgi:hypothetical protein